MTRSRASVDVTTQVYGLVSVSRSRALAFSGLRPCRRDQVLGLVGVTIRVSGLGVTRSKALS